MLNTITIHHRLPFIDFAMSHSFNDEKVNNLDNSRRANLTLYKDKYITEEQYIRTRYLIANVFIKHLNSNNSEYYFSL